MSNCRSRNPCRAATAAIMHSVRYEHTGAKVSDIGCTWLPQSHTVDGACHSLYAARAPRRNQPSRTMLCLANNKAIPDSSHTAQGAYA